MLNWQSIKACKSKWHIPLSSIFTGFRNVTFKDTELHQIVIYAMFEIYLPCKTLLISVFLQLALKYVQIKIYEQVASFILVSFYSFVLWFYLSIFLFLSCILFECNNGKIFFWGKNYSACLLYTRMNESYVAFVALFIHD